MKARERKGIAKRIVELERQLQNNPADKSHIEAEIMKVCSKVDNLEDMMMIDDLVMSELAKNCS